MTARYASTGDVTTLTEEQALGIARFAVNHRTPGWQAFEVLLRMVDRHRDWECDWCRETRIRLEIGIQRTLDGANGGK